MLAVGSPVHAADGDAGAPVKAPTTTTPGTNAPGTNTPATKVAVLSVGTSSDDAESQKMASAVQQSLTNELALTGAKAAVSQSSNDAETRIKTARDAGAIYAVAGDIQAVAGSVRIVGQVYDVKSGKVIAPLQATGPAAEFFGVQDEFVRQARAAIPTTGGSVPPSSPATPSTTGLAPSQSAVSTIPPVSGSHWAGFATAGTTSAPPVVYAAPAPIAPPPPLYGGTRQPYYGGGGYSESGYYYPLPDGYVFPQLGTGRTEYLGYMGVSIIPPPPTVPRSAGSLGSVTSRQPTGPTPLPAYNQSIYKYKNPNTRFAAPVGMPQRAAAPTLRPGT